MDPATHAAPTARWRRPRVTTGDATSAAERADDPTGWAFGDSVVEGLEHVLRARRDIRRYRPDPVPGDHLARVLAAGHAAPSVGHSQPWRFIVVTEPTTRERAAAMADRERLRQAALLEPDRGRRLLDLQLEGIREAPVGIVVTCDRRAAAGGVLGRATFPDADLWSCACAIQNMWLMARGLGLGMGWVTLFDPVELASLMILPDDVETMGWLCLGWPNERPPEPGLERHAWSKRAPLEDVVLRERWPSADSPGPVPPESHLRAPSPARVVDVTDHADGMLTPPGSLGVLDRAIDIVLAAGATSPDGALILVGADHPVVSLGVSAYRGETTREILAAAIAGEAMGVVTARAAGLSVFLVDAGLDGPLLDGAFSARPSGRRGNLRDADAMTRSDVDQLVQLGRSTGSAACPGGLVAVGEVGLGNTTVAAALCCALLTKPAADVVGLGAGADTDMVQRKTAVVEAALARVRSEARLSADDRLDAGDPLDVLAALGGPEIAFLTGAILGAAESRACIVLDGLATSLAALIAARCEPGVRSYLIAGHLSREKSHAAVLVELGREPLLDLRLRAGEGVGAALAAGVLRNGLAVRLRTGRTRMEPRP
ncbi:5,6-dimethylbenzimidazole synthase [Kineosporia sp. R_H_3]|uniref:5,6-dimethylbenzimidazole synthase n=1 Tax=Kineosporia sp. R_H_3 TaxID=1961848 RepID=UPI000B4BA323